MTRIAVVDDDEMFRGQVAKAIQESYAKKKMAVEVEQFHNGRRLLGMLGEKQNYDVYFLDVEMDYISGVDLAKKIRDIDDNAVIVFVTSHEKYAIEGYSCRAFEYVVKDRWKYKLPDVLSRIQRDLDDREERFYRIQTERRYETIRIDDIYLLEKATKNTVFYCKGERQYQERCSLSEVYKRLPEEEFAFVNRGQVINLKYVTHLDGENVELGDFITLAISRYTLNDIRQKLTEYWRVK